MPNPGTTRRTLACLALLAGCAALAGCSPTVGDVVRARASGDVQALTKYLRARDPAVQASALDAIIDVGDDAVRRQIADELFAPSGDPTLAVRLARAWPRRPVILPVLWAAMTSSGASQERNALLARAASDGDRQGFGKFVADRVAARAGDLFAQPRRGSVLLGQLGDGLLERDPARVALSAALELEVESLFRGDATPEGATAFRDRTRTLAAALLVVTQTRDPADCLVVRAILPSFGRVAAALGPRSSGITFSCPMQVPAIRLAASASLTSTKQGDHGSAAPLLEAADVLALTQALGAGDDEARRLERELRGGAKAYEAEASARERMARASSRLAAALERQGDYRPIEGFIVARLEGSVYECATLRLVPSCAGLTCPTPPFVVPTGEHYLLETTQSEFTSKGRFTVLARNAGTRKVAGVDGFSRNVDVYEEIPRELEEALEVATAEMNAAQDAVADRTQDRGELVQEVVALGERWSIPSEDRDPSERARAEEAALGPGVRGGEMVNLPGGTYTMGRTGTKVTVEPFRLDATAVTVGTYQACVQAGACSEPDRGPWCAYGDEARNAHPVTCVDWKQAVTYCAWVGKRLPSEEEWEWAARGAEAATVYPWGNDEPAGQLCWSGRGNERGARGFDQTCTVGSFPGGDSPQGVKDLAGNVREWTSSGYPGAPDRVTRGSSWNYNEGKQVQVTNRIRLSPGHRAGFLGFRCARTAAPESAPASMSDPVSPAAPASGSTL